jgi:hypothetical protein
MHCTHQVLILCPMRHVAYEVVCIMRALLGTAATFTNEERFEEEFGPGDEDEELSLPPVRILPRILLNFLFLLMSLRNHSNCLAMSALLARCALTQSCANYHVCTVCVLRACVLVLLHVNRELMALKHAQELRETS